MVSLALGYFVLYFNIMNPYQIPIASSLIVPLIILFFFGLSVGFVIGNTFCYGLETMVLCTLKGHYKPEPVRYVFEISKAIE